MKKILLAEKIHSLGMEFLKQRAEVSIAKSASTDALKEAVRGMDALIVRSTRLDNEVISSGKDLKVVGRHGIGLDNIDVKFATEKGVAVVNTPNANVISVAEHVISLMLALSKKLPKVDQTLRTGEMSIKGASLPGLCQSMGLSGTELEGKTLGLFGFGKIGSLVAKKCISAFNMQVLAYDPPIYGKIELPEGASWAESKEQLLVRSDFISLHVPLLPATKDLIGEEEFGLMKDSAYLINCARGGVVNEAALAQALKNRVIAGAGIDVFASEPPEKDLELFELDNLIVTPHAAAMTEESLQRMAMEVAEGVIKVLDGEIPPNLVNKDYLNYKK